MDRKMLIRIIPLLSLVIFFIWGWIEGNFEHSWLIFVIGGGAMGIIASLDKDKKAAEQKADDQKPDEQKTDEQKTDEQKTGNK
ncbi:MAG: hypothetical protein J6S60_01190 [Oscillospiraceae bacterium]|nr:hypothetical protein [Oscillospiraceae bacterium]